MAEIKGNGLKRKSEKKRKQVEIVDKIIHVPEVKPKKLVIYFIFVCSY